MTTFSTLFKSWHGTCIIYECKENIPFKTNEGDEQE